MIKLLVPAILILSFMFGWQHSQAMRPDDGLEVVTVQTPDKSNPTLASWYAGYNETYFNDALPHDTLVFVAALPKPYVGLTFPCGKVYCIALDRKLNATDKDQRFTLLHEMLHVEHFGQPEFDNHGPKFIARMRELAREGAFDDIY